MQMKQMNYCFFLMFVYATTLAMDSDWCEVSEDVFRSTFASTTIQNNAHSLYQTVQNVPLFKHIHKAIQEGNIDDAYNLLNYGAATVQGDDGSTALHVAARYNNIIMIQCLLGRGADPRAGDHRKRIPLHYVYSVEAASLLEYDKGNNCLWYNKDNEGKTPLHMAVIEGRSRVIEYFVKQDKSLLKYQCDKGITPAGYAVSDAIKRKLS